MKNKADKELQRVAEQFEKNVTNSMGLQVSGDTMEELKESIKQATLELLPAGGRYDVQVRTEFSAFPWYKRLYLNLFDKEAAQRAKATLFADVILLKKRPMDRVMIDPHH